MDRNVKKLSVLVLGVVVMLGMGGVCDGAEGESGVKGLIEQLGDESFEVRERATEALMLHGGVTDGTLGEALRGSEGEKRHRLVNVAMHLFYERMGESFELKIPEGLARSGQVESVGAIGIDTPDTNLVRSDQHEGLDHAGWLITGTRPGFPGFVLLRSGDIITGLEGESFTDDLDQGYFIDMIQQYGAGETMVLNVMRGDKQIDVTMVIGMKARLMHVAEQLMSSGDQRPQMFEPWRKHLGNLLGEKVFKPAIVIGSPTPE